MTYIPNFNDARTRRRMKSALGMTLGCLTDTKPRPLGTRFIDKHFGQAQHQFSIWLRNQLLICTDNNYNKDTGKVKEYIYNTEGVNRIKEILDCSFEYKPHAISSYIHQKTLSNHNLAVEWARDTYEFTDEYEDKSNRLFHPVQFMRKHTRNSFLKEHGMQIQYDIRTAAPTLLHQRSWIYSYGHVLETIDHYTNNKSDIRKKLSHETGLPEENIKVLINSLFAGASLGTSSRFSCWNYCNQDPVIIDFLKQHPYIIALRADIKQMWEYLRPELPVYQVTTQTGLKRNMQMTPRNKWHLYFSLERQVLNEIRSYLIECGLDYFLIHDAFVSKELPFGVSDLEMWIEAGTGFKINFDQEILLYYYTPSV